jgi:hypothetical protein
VDLLASFSESTATEWILQLLAFSSHPLPKYAESTGQFIDRDKTTNPVTTSAVPIDFPEVNVSPKNMTEKSITNTKARLING